MKPTERIREIIKKTNGQMTAFDIAIGSGVDLSTTRKVMDHLLTKNNPELILVGKVSIGGGHQTRVYEKPALRVLTDYTLLDDIIYKWSRASRPIPLMTGTRLSDLLPLRSNSTQQESSSVCEVL